MKKSNVLATMLQHAKENPSFHRGKCWACSLPPEYLEAANEMRRQGHTAREITNALIATGRKDATRARLDHHFSSGHDKK